MSSTNLISVISVSSSKLLMEMFNDTGYSQHAVNPGRFPLDIHQSVIQHLLTIVVHLLAHLPNVASIPGKFLYHSNKGIAKDLIKCITEILIHYAYCISLENTLK